MIEIVDKSKCCGCEACRSICPKKCISMQADKEGFLYPKVDLSQCVDCKLCEKVCPVLNPKYSKKEPLAYAGINNDINIRLQSSSGGIFTLIAEQVILKKELSLELVLMNNGMLCTTIQKQKKDFHASVDQNMCKVI